MRTLTEVVGKPSALDSRSNYIGADLDQFSGLYVVMTRNRDSDILTESNWACALKALGGESDTVVIHRFNHWACGWWEALCVTGDSVAQGQAIVDKIENYPVLDETHYSNAEYEAAVECWQGLSIKERVELCQRYRCCIFSARHDYLPSDDDSGGLLDYLAH